MRIAIISDIHGNFPALKAVLDTIAKMEIDHILCMGDIVGYGPQPLECIEELKGRQIVSVMGNHDACVLGLLNDRFFGEPNRGLLSWTRGVLGKEHLAWLQQLPMTIQGHIGNGLLTTNNDSIATDGGFTYVAAHSSPKNPDQWEWLDSAIRCREILSEFTHDFIFVGHTHVPALIANEIGVFGLESGYRFLINPGSVGQSRDHDWRASFGILDMASPSYKQYRIEYDIRKTKSALYELGFTDLQVRRLLNV